MSVVSAKLAKQSQPGPYTLITIVYPECTIPYTSMCTYHSSTMLCTLGTQKCAWCVHAQNMLLWLHIIVYFWYTKMCIPKKVCITLAWGIRTVYIWANLLSTPASHPFLSRSLSIILSLRLPLPSVLTHSFPFYPSLPLCSQLNTQTLPKIQLAPQWAPISWSRQRLATNLMHF